MSRRSRRRGRGSRFDEGEELNPMNYLTNLSDVMLVLAVGIMVALILHWKVPIETNDSSESTQSSQDSVTTFTEDELQSQEDVPDDMEQMGEVYYDSESGKYYILENNDDSSK